LVIVDGLTSEVSAVAPPRTRSPPAVTNIYVGVAFKIVDNAGKQTTTGRVGGPQAQLTDESFGAVGLEPGSEIVEDLETVSANRR